MGRRKLGAICLAAIIAAVLALFLFSPLTEWLSIERLKQSQEALAGLVEARPFFCMAAFFLFCAILSAGCFPAAPVLGVSAGALFGLWPGLLLVLVAMSIGSTIAFFDARFLLRDWLKGTLCKRMETIDRGIERNGALYLLTLRLNPLVPYWLVNLAMGLTEMPLRTYALLTVTGLIPASFIYVSAGTQLATLEHAADILSVSLLSMMLALSLLPLFVKGALLAFTAPLPDLS